MKHNKKYIIPFKGLKDGNHTFQYKLEKEFFDLFDAKDINQVELTADIQLIKKTNHIELVFNLKGHIEVICDVCLDFYQQKIANSGKIYIRFGEETMELSDELIVLPQNQTEIEISQFLFDFSMLGIPVKKQHPTNLKGELECDPDMIKILKKLESSSVLEKKTDPRWNKLNQLKH